MAPPVLYTIPDNTDPPAPPDPDPEPTDPGDDGGVSGGGGQITVTTGTRTWQSTTVATKKAKYRMTASYSNNGDGDSIRRRIVYWRDGVKEHTGTHGTTTASSNSYDSTTNGQTDKELVCDDNTYSWRARCVNLTDAGQPEVIGSLKYFKTASIPATSSAPTEPTGANLEATQAYIEVNCYPNTLHSTATLQLQYRESGGSWANFGTSADTGGYSEVTFGRQLTGLTAETVYEVRLQITRDSVDNTSLTSSTTSFTTLADTPEVTTDEESNLAHETVTMNATVDHNTQDGNLSWRIVETASYSAPPDDVQGTETAYSGNPITEDGSYSQGVTGLTEDTAYTFWAIYEYDGGTKIYGDADTFTTKVAPTTTAAKEARMQVYEYKRKYGVILTGKPLFFTLQTPSGTDSDTFVVGATVAAADCLISKDGGAFAETDNQPATLGNGYTLVLTAEEMEANEIDVIIKDAAGGPDFRDCHLRIITHLELGTIDVDAATGTKDTNTDAVSLTGYGTGAGLKATGGATGKDIEGTLGSMAQYEGTLAAYGGTTTITLAATAPAVADELNGSIILFTGGTGSGQARVITDYSAGRVATLNKAVTSALSTDTTYIVLPSYETWAISPGAKLSALPAFTSNYADMLQFAFERFHNKRTQTATLFTLRDGDDSGNLGSNAVDDDGTTQTHNQMT